MQRIGIVLFVMTVSSFAVMPAYAEPQAAPTPDSSLVVNSASGELRGAARPNGGAEFLGIPYAQPPVGDLRWREPLPAKPWTGARDATKFGAPCAQPVLGDWNQHDAETGNEDCLFLNVITTVWPPKHPLPVMFWIHGGANAGGTASSELYKNGKLVEHGIILVTANYRLSVFGFFAHPLLTRESLHHASGNYGLMDQIAALKWVHDNIAKFGGDPANITVFGQSAGAADASLLMVSPRSKGSFQRAIAQSGSALTSPLPPLAVAEQAGQELAAGLKAPSDDTAIRSLRQVSAQDLLKAIAVAGQNPSPGAPDLDGWVIPVSPAEVIASGQQSDIPMMIGTTTREFGSSMSPDELRKMAHQQVPTSADRVLALYGLANNDAGTSDPTYGTVADQLIADWSFRCPATLQAALHTAVHHAVYEYEFEHAIPGQEAQGAVHSADLPYVFGFYPKSGNISGGFGEVDFQLADLMETYWTNFAKTGNPNGGALPKWPEFGTSQLFLKFTQDGHAVASTGALRAPQCELYRDVQKERTKQN
jgi:para-nitrobenzyl esterase